jgi:uncharacterized protein (DUF433 family)
MFPETILMADSKTYVRTDASGAMRVGESDISLDSVLHAWDQGHSPEAIRTQFPGLTLEEIYGAIAWMLGHTDEVAAYVKRQDALWAQERAKAAQNEPPVVRRLREMLKTGARGK